MWVRRILLFIILFVSVPALAWDATGHRLIAAIAYQHLTPQAREKIDQLSKIGDEHYPPYQRFLFAAIWPDIYVRDNPSTKSWHYIDYPLSVDGTPAREIKKENVVWAIARAQQLLQAKNISPEEQAKALRFLEHFVGDSHQPLHCVNRFSHAHPEGDAGGNYFSIYNRDADNLHAIWDQGVGLFRAQAYRYPLRTKDIKRLAQRIELEYPESYFGAQAKDLNPENWCKEGFTIAKDFVYTTPENSALSAEYISKAQKIVAQRIALAGYRLANLLNGL